MITSGDLRLAANQTCLPEQKDLEACSTAAFAAESVELVRAFSVDESEGQGFISSQRMGMDVFMNIQADAPLVFATAAWQYTHHVLPGLRSHKGPISDGRKLVGQWPGLVGLLNLNGSLVKAGVHFSTVFSEEFTDDFFRTSLKQWLRDKTISHDLSHVRPLDAAAIPEETAALRRSLAQNLKPLHVDLGRVSVGSLPAEETKRRWRETTYQWPIVLAVLHGVRRDQFMARHRANQVNIVYAPTGTEADKTLAVKAALFSELGIAVHLCGDV